MTSAFEYYLIGLFKLSSIDTVITALNNLNTKHIRRVEIICQLSLTLYNFHQRRSFKDEYNNNYSE